MTRSYTDIQLMEAVKISSNFKQVQFNLGFENDSHSRRTVIQRRIVELNLDIDHFKRKRKFTTRRKITDEIMFSTQYATLTNTGGSTNKAVIDRLIELGKAYKCDNCGISEWNGEYLRLQLEHIDGNSRNYNKDNLSFLCPNCHSQTPTFSRKNRKGLL